MEFKVPRSQAGEGAREWSRVSGSEPGIIKFCNAQPQGVFFYQHAMCVRCGYDHNILGTLCLVEVRVQ